MVRQREMSFTRLYPIAAAFGENPKANHSTQNLHPFERISEVFPFLDLALRGCQDVCILAIGLFLGPSFRLRIFDLGTSLKLSVPDPDGLPPILVDCDQVIGIV